MSIKCLESLKPQQDKNLQLLINDSFNYYAFNSSIPEYIQEDASNIKSFSSLIRFYRSINSNKKIDEETFSNPLISCKSSFFSLFPEALLLYCQE